MWISNFSISSLPGGEDHTVSPFPHIPHLYLCLCLLSELRPGQSAANNLLGRQSNYLPVVRLETLAVFCPVS